MPFQHIAPWHLTPATFRGARGRSPPRWLGGAARGRAASQQHREPRPRPGAAVRRIARAAERGASDAADNDGVGVEVRGGAVRRLRWRNSSARGATPRTAPWHASMDSDNLFCHVPCIRLRRARFDRGNEMGRILPLILFSGAAVVTSAQTLGTITGEVTDATAAVVPGATVTIRNVDTNATRTVVTNADGLYSVPLLPPGIYDVRVEKQGFRGAARSAIELQVQQTARVDFALAVGEVSETLNVAGQAALLNTEDATVGTVIEEKRIVELPLNGRNFLQLVSLSPNVTSGFSSQGQATVRQGGDRANQNMAIAGARASWNYYTLDGVTNTDPISIPISSCPM
jgi:hypothetical protein